jgi:hypothetical protein
LAFSDNRSRQDALIEIKNQRKLFARRLARIEAAVE